MENVWILQAGSGALDRIGNIRVWRMHAPPSTADLEKQLAEWGRCEHHAGHAATQLSQFGALEDRERVYATFGLVPVS